MRHVRKFNNFIAPTYENAISRVYLGVHWRFDGLPPAGSTKAIGGVPLGLRIANNVWSFF